MYIDEACTAIEANEGSIPWLYLDTRGNVTVGVGLMLPTLISALALPLRIEGMGGDLSATPEQITDDWFRVKGSPMGRTADFYEKSSSVFLVKSEIESRLRVTIVGIDIKLTAHMCGYHSFPDPAKIALLDMAYNLGVEGLLEGYPRLIAACEDGAWLTAALESHRSGPSATRNLWTANQFKAAASQQFPDSGK